MKWLDKIHLNSDLERSSWAIDIGTSGIRRVSLKRRGKKVKAGSGEEFPVSRKEAGPAGEEAVREALRNLLRGKKIKGETAISALPIQQAFVRTLVLPFNKPAQIKSVIASEAELNIPFPLDRIILDFWVMEELAGGKSRVLMVAVKKTVLGEHLQLLSESGIQPAVVSLDFIGLANAYRLTGLIDPQEVTALVEVGATHTAVAFYSRAKLRFLRSFGWGGDLLTKAISGELKCDWERAELLKISPSSPEKEQLLSRALSSCWPALEGELIRTIQSAASATEGRSATRLFLTGGGAKIEELRKMISRQFGCPVEKADPWERINTAKISPEVSLNQLTAAGLALSALRPESEKINFRRMEFTFPGSARALKRKLLLAIGLGVGVLAVLGALFLSKIYREKHRSDMLELEMRHLLATAFPGSGEITPGRELQQMEKALQREKTDVEYFQALNSISALDILREISRIIPERLKIQVVELDINQKRVRFIGRTDSFRSAALVKNALNKSDFFQGDKIRSGDTKLRKKGGKVVTVEFNYTIPLREEVPLKDNQKIKQRREEGLGE